MKQFLLVGVSFAFISREYILEHLPITAKNNIFNNHNTNDNKWNINTKRDNNNDNNNNNNNGDTTTNRNIINYIQFCNS